MVLCTLGSQVVDIVNGFSFFFISLFHFFFGTLHWGLVGYFGDFCGGIIFSQTIYYTGLRGLKGYLGVFCGVDN